MTTDYTKAIDFQIMIYNELETIPQSNLETVTVDCDLTMLKLCHGIGPI